MDAVEQIVVEATTPVEVTAESYLRTSAHGTLTLQLGRRKRDGGPMQFDVVPPTVEALEEFTREARALGADPKDPLVTVCVGLDLVALAVSVPAHLTTPERTDHAED
jgi:hypothetical protein